MKKPFKRVNTTEWFKIKSYRSLPNVFKDQSKALSWECFMSWRSEEERAEEKDKYYATPCAHILAIENHKLIGKITLFKRSLDYGDKRIILGGVGGVCVAKEKRERGVATSMLERSIIELKKQNCDVAFLTTDVDKPYMVGLYAKVGFAVLRKNYTFLGKSGKRYTENDGMIAPVKSKQKFDYIMKSKKILDLGNSSF
jgi:predicted acetyltransferase